MLTKFGLPRPPQPYKISTTFSLVKKFRFQARILFKSLSFVIFDISPIARPIFSHGLPPLRNQMALSTALSLTKKVTEIEPEESKDDFSVPPSDNSQAGFHEDPKSSANAGSRMGVWLQASYYHDRRLASVSAHAAGNVNHRYGRW